MDRIDTLIDAVKETISAADKHAIQYAKVFADSMDCTNFHIETKSASLPETGTAQTVDFYGNVPLESIDCLFGLRIRFLHDQVYLAVYDIGRQLSEMETNFMVHAMPQWNAADDFTKRHYTDGVLHFTAHLDFSGKAFHPRDVLGGMHLLLRTADSALKQGRELLQSNGLLQ